MKLRRRTGAVLGLVASCVLVVIVIGIGLFCLTRMMGGGREVAHATDSGILNIAKQALDTPSIPAAGTDFVACGTPVNSQSISLYSYNKCVGQAMLVALNASASNQSVAGQHAKLVYDQLVNSIEKPLQSALLGGHSANFDYKQIFSNLSNQNSVRMSGSNPVTAPGYAAAYMKGGTSNANAVGSSNLYFNLSGASQALLSTIPVNSSATFVPPGVGSTTTAYVQGYKPMDITVPGVDKLTYMTVPVFPSQPPHLVSFGDFNNATSPPQADTNIPPNAVKVSSSSVDGTANTLTGAVACAIVGSLDQGYAASFPAGYIEIFNRPGTTMTGYGPVDNGNNIFNNEMFGNPGVSLSAMSDGSAAFSCGYAGGLQNPAPTTNLVDQWSAYNTTGTGPIPPVAGSSGLNNGADDAIFFATTPGQAGTAVTDRAKLATIKNSTNCMKQQQQQGYVSGNCLKWMSSIAASYGRTMPNNNGAQDLSTLGPVFSNVDVVKVTVLQQFQNRVQSFAVNAPATPTFPDNASMNGSTGMGVYNVNNPGSMQGFTYPTPANSLPIMQAMSPLNYLQQIDGESQSSGCAISGNNSVLAAVTQRCQQIQPTVTAQQVKALLDSNKQFKMGMRFYIYLPGGDQSATGPYGGLVMDNGGNGSGGGPVGYNASNPAVPDGVPVNPLPGDPAHNCTGVYSLNNTIVNVPRNPQVGYPAFGAPISQGDLNVHAQPYMVTNSEGNVGGLASSDHALWQDSSGYGNLLGHLEFANTVTGGNAFSSPN